MFYSGPIIGVIMGCFTGIFISGLWVAARKGDAAVVRPEYNDSVSGKVAGETADSGIWELRAALPWFHVDVMNAPYSDCWY